MRPILGRGREREKEGGREGRREGERGKERENSVYWHHRTA